MSARITAGDSEPERFCRDFCSLRNYVREEQDDVGPTPPGDDRRVQRGGVNGPELGRERKHR